MNISTHFTLMVLRASHLNGNRPGIFRLALVEVTPILNPGLASILVRYPHLIRSYAGALILLLLFLKKSSSASVVIVLSTSLARNQPLRAIPTP